MALKKKTFTWGSYAYQSVSNAYVLELTLTEKSTDQEKNTSSVGYSLVLKSGSQNRFTGVIDSVLKLKGETVASGTKSITAAYNSSWTLLSGTYTVAHNADGSLDMPIVVSINTYNSYAPPDKTLNWSWALTKIPRASSITSAGDVELGNACSVKWTPNSASFYYKLQFSLGDWSYTTDVIHPNKTSAYTYADYVIPIEVAEQITEGSSGTMTIKLTTYSDSACETSIGSDSETFTVSVPATDETRPVVEMELTPGITPLAGLYLQGLSKVQAKLNAEGKLGAGIKSYSLVVEGKNYEDPYISDYLTTVGELEVTGCAVDSRGITGYVYQKITVLPYSKPKVQAVAGENNVVAARCDLNGNPSNTGRYLLIKAKISYEKVVANGIQNNFGKIQFRYKEDSANAYSNWITALDTKTSDIEEIVNEALPDISLSVKANYQVQVRVVDDIDESEPITLSVPSEAVYMDRPPGGKSMGLGGYSSGDGNLDVYWRTKARGGMSLFNKEGEEISVDEVFPFPRGHLEEGWNPDNILNGVYEVDIYPLKDNSGNVLIEKGVLIQLAATINGSVLLQLAFPADSNTPVYRLGWNTNWSDWTTF